MAVAALDKDAREELDEINVFLANVSDKVAPEKLGGQGAEIKVFHHHRQQAYFSFGFSVNSRCHDGEQRLALVRERHVRAAKPL